MRFASERALSFTFPGCIRGWRRERGKPVREVRMMYRGLHRYQMEPGPEFSFFAIPRRSSRRRPPWWKIRISLGIVAWHSVFTERTECTEGAAHPTFANRFASSFFLFSLHFFLFFFFPSSRHFVRISDRCDQFESERLTNREGGEGFEEFLNWIRMLISDDMDIPRSLISQKRRS